MKLNTTPVDTIREVLIAATDMVPCGEEPYVGWSAVLADRIAEALGLLDMDGFVRRVHEGYFDDSGPSAVEYACMRQAVEYAFSATAETGGTHGNG